MILTVSPSMSLVFVQWHKKYNIHTYMTIEAVGSGENQVVLCFADWALSQKFWVRTEQAAGYWAALYFIRGCRVSPERFPAADFLWVGIYRRPNNYCKTQPSSSPIHRLSSYRTYNTPQFDASQLKEVQGSRQILWVGGVEFHELGWFAWVVLSCFWLQ